MKRERAVTVQEYVEQARELAHGLLEFSTEWSASPDLAPEAKEGLGDLAATARRILLLVNANGVGHA